MPPYRRQFTGARRAQVGSWGSKFSRRHTTPAAIRETTVRGNSEPAPRRKRNAQRPSESIVQLETAFVLGNLN